VDELSAPIPNHAILGRHHMVHLTTELQFCVTSTLALGLCCSGLFAADESRRFVYPNGSKLVYETDTQGNRIPDFSHAGYGGGGVPLPEVPARVSITPAEGDDGARIQAAIDHVSHLTPNGQGLRGAVLLAKGRYEIGGQLRINASGVVLRGEGRGTNGTVLVATGTGRRTLVQVRGKFDRSTTGRLTAVADRCVPVGATKMHLAGVSALRAGDAVLIKRPSTRGWIDALGMFQFPGRTGGDGRFSWVPGKMDLEWDRVVAAIEGDEITLDAPLTTALDDSFGGGSVSTYSWPGRLNQVGVENLRCESAFDAANPLDEEHSWMAISFEAAQNAWVRQVTAVHFVSSLVSVWESCKWMTVQDCESLAPVSELAGYRRHSFYASGQLTLFQRCHAENGRHDFAIGYLAAGPNVFLDCSAANAHDFSGAIESWASGILFDNVTMDGGGLSFDNREIFDQGVGWAAANSVIWQCTAPLITLRRPPTAQNWAIGVWGQFLGNGHWRQVNEFVSPVSLYRAQLAERLGDKALAALQHHEIETLSEAQKSLLRSSRGNEALTSDSSLPTEPSLTPTSQSLLTSAATNRMVLTNGWLVCGGKLMMGEQAGLNWWRGHMLPSRAPDFGPSITRFTPGRSGLGFTDDLDALTDSMVRSNQVALRHHWGLWYDRRRDDHQMIRRQNADVWPPFYEQPWARSGFGQSWTRLSRYDLTRFNPWYFGRLREFAGFCRSKDLVLVNEMYFQHNILEAGAHWADFPWRPANCLQDTGFPEPPAYAGNKRIFMAEQFYDVTHPVRRELHRAFIRQCLANLTGEPNVIHLTGAEFSGPLPFMQFWCDVAAEWIAETGIKPLLGLSAPKDVQDAILADPERSRVVSLIDLKYWWPSEKGLYAPKGGQNLAPRQHLREWRGGGPSAVLTAAMVREWRLRHPDKAIICDFDRMDGWAFASAGGSFPRLPSTTDARLLAALPRMKPLPPALGSSEKQFILAEPGQNYFVYDHDGGDLALDLSGVVNKFKVQRIELSSGKIVPGGEIIDAGKMATLKAQRGKPVAVWLTR
jgi:hypothetical protein